MAAPNVNKSSARVCFTLPISCQICLDKVKDPVVCSNRHVFCSQCVDLWLQRSSICPTCRTDISGNSPCQSILGGPNVQSDSQRNAESCSSSDRKDLRRIRLELLCKDYENEIDQLEERVEKLMIETDQLKQERESLRKQLTTYTSSLLESSSSETPTSLSSSATTLTPSKRKPTSLCYFSECEEIKAELRREKKESARREEENYNLKRELQTLKQELVVRSPRRFGRHTVGALENELQAASREISQLTRALEKSDERIVQLENELAALCQGNVAISKEMPSGDSSGSKQFLHISSSACDASDHSTWPQGNTASTSENSSVDLSRNNCLPLSSSTENDGGNCSTEGQWVVASTSTTANSVVYGRQTCSTNERAASCSSADDDVHVAGDFISTGNSNASSSENSSATAFPQSTAAISTTVKSSPCMKRLKFSDL